MKNPIFQIKFSLMTYYYTYYGTKRWLTLILIFVMADTETDYLYKFKFVNTIFTFSFQTLKKYSACRK